MLELRVLKRFIGKEEGKTLAPGDKVTTKDLQRVNTLVSRGYCEIQSIVAPVPEKPEDAENPEKPEGSKGKGAKDGKKE